MTLILLPLLLLPNPQQESVSLGRVFTAGEKQEYAVNSHLLLEQRQRGLQTWFPEELDLNYKFSLEVKTMKADGIVDLRYLRPTMTEIQGETADAGPKTKVEKVNMDMLLTVSPINEILSVKDLAKKDPPKKGGGTMSFSRFGRSKSVQDFMAYIGEIYRLSLFAGSFDSALDFAPKTPFDEVKPGDAWKKTVGYSPQKLKGKDGKSAVQRLDYTYVYKGIIEVSGRKVYRVEADLDMVSDLAAFFHQVTGSKPEETGLKEFPLTLKAHIDFDLDLKTRHTILAVAKSQGGFKVVTSDFPNDPQEEVKLRGETRMRRIK